MNHSDVHLILNSYATHKDPNLKAWLEKNPRFHRHFTPTSDSWVNMVESFFKDITVECIPRGVFHRVNNKKSR